MFDRLARADVKYLLNIYRVAQSNGFIIRAMTKANEPTRTRRIVDALGGIPLTAATAECTSQAVYTWLWNDSIPKRALMLLKARKPRVFKTLDAEDAATKADE